MKKISMKSMLLLCALMAGVGSAGAQEQQGEEPETKIKYILTAPKDIKATDIVVIADTAALVAIQNDAADGKAPTAGKIKLNDNKDQLVVEDNSGSSSGTSGSSTTSYGATADINKLEWNVQADGDLCNFFVNVTEGEGDSQTTTQKFLFVTNADDGLRMGTPADGDVKAFGLAKDEGNNQADFLSVTIGDGYRYVGVKSIIGIINSWQTKASIDDDIKNTKIAFFVKKESVKQDLTLKFEKENYEADYNGGNGSFTAPTLTIDPNIEVSLTYSSSDETTATVNAKTGAITLVGRGTTKITVSAAETLSTDATSTSYTLRVDDSTGEGSQANPFKPSEAIAALKNVDTKTGGNYFVEGYVAKIEEKDIKSILSKSDNTEGTLTYWISNDGVYDDVTKNTLKISTGKYKELANLTDRILSVGDKVTVVGPLSYASTTPSSSTFGGSTSGSSSGSTTPGSSTSTDEKEFRMDATNYIHVHTPVLVKKDKQMIVNQEINAEDFATEAGLYTINTEAMSGSLTGSGVTIESSNNSVAKVATGSGKFVSSEIGTTVITVTVPATTDAGKSYELKGKFTVTVINRNVTPAAAEQYELVTAENPLKNGDKLLIVASAKDIADDANNKVVAMSTTQDDADRGSVDIVVDGNIISTVPEGAQVVTYEVKNGKNYLNVGKDADGVKHYLYASSSDEDELKTGELYELDDNAAVAVTIDESTNEATIKFQGSNTHNTLKFSSGLILGYDLGSTFACFDESSSSTGTGSSTGSGSKDTLPKLFRYVKTDSYDVTINASGYKTFVAGEDFVLPSGLQALIVTEVATEGEEKIAKLTDVSENNIKANTGYILKGTANETYTLTTTTTEATAPDGNKLLVSDASTGNGVFVLATHKGETAFYKWNGGLLGAGRVYLPADVAGTREFILLDENATGIAEVKSETATDNRYYNLNGQQVAQPQRGLYIVNGKKIIVK